jgi:hypothetical protein
MKQVDKFFQKVKEKRTIGSGKKGLDGVAEKAGRICLVSCVIQATEACTVPPQMPDVLE